MNTIKKSCAITATFALGGVLAVALNAAAAPRTVTFTSYDEATHAATLIIGAGDGTKSDVKYLFAAFGREDRGVTPSGWEAVRYVKTLYAASTNETHVWTLPEAWRVESGAIRFFLVAPSGPRVQEGMYLSSLTSAAQRNIEGGSHFQYLDTGIVPDANTEITLETAVQNNAYVAPFGVAGQFYLFSSGLDNSACDFFGNLSRPEKWNPPGDDGVHQIRIGASGAFVDGVRVAGPYTKPSGSTALTMWLFGRNNSESYPVNITSATTDSQAQTIQDKNKLGPIKIYSATITTNGVLARAFSPRVVDGTPVMWDAVTETAFGNSAPGSVAPFICGETSVSPSDGICETCSTARVFSKHITKMTADAKERSITLTLGGDARSCALYAVRGAEDLGANSDPKDWDEALLVGKIPASTTSYTAILPAEWWRSGGFARFVLASTAFYDWAIVSLSSSQEGFQYIDTGVIPVKDMTTTIRMKQPTGSDMASFGLQSPAYTCFMNGGRFYYACFTEIAYLSADSADCPVSDGEDHLISLGPDGAVCDGNTYATFQNQSSTKATLTMPLFARRASDGSLNKYGPCTIYCVQMRVGGTLVRDYIPVAKDGVGYFYDRVTGELYGNANAAADAEPLGMGDAPATPSDGVFSVSACVMLKRGMTIVIR